MMDYEILENIPLWIIRGDNTVVLKTPHDDEMQEIISYFLDASIIKDKIEAYKFLTTVQNKQKHNKTYIEPGNDYARINVMYNTRFKPVAVWEITLARQAFGKGTINDLIKIVDKYKKLKRR